MTTLEVGYEVDIVDEQLPVAAPTATDTCFLLHSVASGTSARFLAVTSPQVARDEYPAEADLLAHVDAFFGEGGGRLYLSVLDATDIPASLARFTSDLGPGQIVAPEVVTAATQVTIADWGYANNRVYIADGPDGATDAALTTLAEAVIAAEGGRFASLEADTLIIPGTASGQTREVAASIVKAALIARNDITYENPNVAAAGVQNGRCQYALGLKTTRTDDSRQTLAAAQVNTFKMVYGRYLAAYGYLALADLGQIAHWWDFNGARTVMAARAREAAVAEQHMFGQIDGEGNFLTRYEGGLRSELAALQRAGALYGTNQSPGYRVDVSTGINPIDELALGHVVAVLYLKTSPHARVLRVRIVRRRLDQEA